jgi:hypothetical protein
MKRVINGKLYNTETAEAVFENESRHYRSDFKWFEETLYKTKKGAWFIAGEGGPMSHYSAQSGNSYTYGFGLRVLTPNEALAYLEENEADPDIIAEHFRDKIEEA